MTRTRRIGSTLVSALVLVAPSLACGFAAEQRERIAPMAAACDGTGDARAPAYVPGQGPHPIMALGRVRPDGAWTQSLGRLTTRTPAGGSVERTQLVLCEDPPRELELGECAFDRVLRVGLVPVPGVRADGPSFPRVQVEQRARIVAVASGQTIAEQVFRGADPPPCDRSITGEPSASDFRGAAVPSAEVDAWAEGYALDVAR